MDDINRNTTIGEIFTKGRIYERNMASIETICTIILTQESISDETKLSLGKDLLKLSELETSMSQYRTDYSYSEIKVLDLYDQTEKYLIELEQKVKVQQQTSTISDLQSLEDDLPF